MNGERQEAMPAEPALRIPAPRVEVPVVPLAKAPGRLWGRPTWVVLVWAVVELLVVTNPWQISSRLRVAALRLFGAQIGTGVVFRPRTRVRFPWNLEIGNDCWIGEGAWFTNDDRIVVGNDVIISQEAFLCTASHDHRRDMSVISRPIVLCDGVWVTTRCIVLGGAHMGRSALAKPMTIINGEVPANAIVAGPGGVVVGTRFDLSAMTR